MGSADDFSGEEVNEFTSVVEENLETSRMIERMLDGEKKPMSLHRNLHFD